MTLGSELTADAKELAKWYVAQVDMLLEWYMEEDPPFVERMSEDDEYGEYAKRTDADWMARTQESGIEQANQEYQQYMKLAEKRGQGAPVP